MSPHRVVIEAGPGAIRRACCGTVAVADAEISRAALEAIDDTVALLDGRPVSVDSVWCDVLRSLDCGSPQVHDAIVVVHPSWWSASRIGLVTAAAAELSDDVTVRPRSSLLAHAADAAPEATVVVEIADRLVAVVGHEVVAVARRMEPQPANGIAEEVVHAVAEMTRDATATVLIDAPSAIPGAPELAAAIASGMRAAGRAAAQIVEQIDAARSWRRPPDDQSEGTAGAAATRRRGRKPAWIAAAGVVLAAAVPAVSTGVKPPGMSSAVRAPTTFLVEGRVALTVPADWPTQRVVAGPGSPRVRVTSPVDPELALHITQSSIPGETLSGTAERLKHAIDAEPPGVFVDFNPSTTSGGRPAVTYRELRAGHQVAWTVLLDGTVRISVGCQSRSGGEGAVRDVCEQAIRSARALN